MISPVMAAMAWRMMFGVKYGAINNMGLQLGLIDVYFDWFATPLLSIVAVVLVDVWHNTPFMMLVLLESFWVTVTGLILGLALRELVLRGLAPWVMTEIGIRWVPGWPQANEWRLMAALMVTALAFGLVPAWRAWKMSLTDGLMPRS